MQLALTNLIQKFKFTNSSTLRQKFPTNTTVNDLLDFVYNKELAWNPSVVKENIQLVNVSPKKLQIGMY